MGTLTRILIKNVGKTEVSQQIKNHYSTGRTQTFDYEYKEVFLDQMNYSFTIFDAYLNDWTELAVGFNNAVIEHDEFLIKLSSNFQTMVIFGYEQTTTGDARLKVWDNGEISRSIYQKSDFDADIIVMEENIGNRYSKEAEFNYPSIGQSCQGFKFLDFDDIQTIFEDAGYQGVKRMNFDKEYLHLEYLKNKKRTHNKR